MKGLLFSMVSFSFSLTAWASEIQTIDELVEKFPPVVSFDHGADLLALETGKPADVFEKHAESGLQCPTQRHKQGALTRKHPYHPNFPIWAGVANNEIPTELGKVEFNFFPINIT